MSPHQSNHEAGLQKRSGLSWVFYAFLFVALFFLLTEHRAHLFGALPFLLLALCPLMHLFHGGHGGHGGTETRRGHAEGGAANDEPAGGASQSTPSATEPARPASAATPHKH